MGWEDRESRDLWIGKLLGGEMLLSRVEGGYSSFIIYIFQLCHQTHSIENVYCDKALCP